MRHRTLILLLCVPLAAFSQVDPGLLGTWELLPHKSTDIDLYRTIGVELRASGKEIVVVNTWGGKGRNHCDSVVVKTDGSVTKVPVTSRVFPSNAFMGLMMVVGSEREISASVHSGGKLLKLKEKARVRGSQGPIAMSVERTFALAPDGETMSYTIGRSSRTTGPPMTYVLKREGSSRAYMMKLEDDWAIDGKLSVNAFLISLQGLANLKAPQLYFVYPEKWDFLYTPGVLDYYREKRNYTFIELRTPEQALQTFRGSAKGYVVWDKAVRTSLIVAYTLAGLEEAVVVSEELIPMVEKAGLKPVEDFRGKFTGKSDIEIFTWAYEQYWKRCSRDYVVWLGGEHGKIMKPGVADFGMYKKAFFSDLSCEVVDTAEYALAYKMLSNQKPLSMVLGWHSYAKDKERDYVTLTSQFGLRVEGLHTLPNMSFSCQTPASPGFVWKNNHNVVPGKKYTPENKVYVALVQTDGMGLGAWFKSGRGAIPCSWEVTMNFIWMAPVMLEYFWTTATPNDYFVGGLSGPGYMYPKAIPPDKLPGVVAMTREQTRELDLPVFEFMDYSEGATVEGNTDLTEEVFEAYLKGMPEATGFINGYAPAFTFALREGKPLVSFDYYLSPERPEADAAADLEELAAVNPKRPYFLLIHIREYSDLRRTKNILDRLGRGFEVVPLDLFLKYAAEEPTFEERFRDATWTKDKRQFE